MTCKEIHEQITAYVDNRVDEQEYRAKVQQHIKYCPDCRAAYELELMTKMVVRERAQRSAAPDSLRASIERGVDSMSDQRKQSIGTAVAGGESESRSERFWELFTAPVGVAVAVLLVIIGTYVIVNPSGQSSAVIVDTPAAPSGNGEAKIAAENFFNKALQNFEAIRAGQLAPQHSTDDSKELSEYFRENGVGYNVAFMQVRAPLAGGVVSKHGDARFAHIIYNRDEEIYYVFEVPQESLRRGDAVYVTKDVLERLDRGEKIWEEPGGSERLVMFKKGDIVCAMVSNAPRAAMESVAG